MKKHSSKWVIVLIITIAAIILYLGSNQLSGKNPDNPKNTGTGQDYQEIRMSVEGIDYVPSELTVEAGKPVRFIVDGTRAEGCVQYFTIPKYGISTELKAGENVFEFTPDKTGEIPFSCAMQMSNGIIKVVEKLQETKTKVEDKAETVKKTFEIGEGIEISNLPPAKSSTIMYVKNGSEITLTADIVVKEINGVKYKMYAYNGMIPGIAFKVDKGSRIKVDFQNNIDQNTTIHWHGLRQNVKDDGVPGISQKPVKPGENYIYNLYFPDEGIYWYHPHIREDIQQEGGLAGNVIVMPSKNYYNPVNTEELLMLDDIFIQNNSLAPFGSENANFAIMGRFGNVMLMNGDTKYKLDVKKGDTIRFYITNIANVRPFNVSFSGARMKLIGSDLGKYERETYVRSVVVAPAERYTVEVYFDTTGEYKIQNINPHFTYDIGTIKVSQESTENDYSSVFFQLKENSEIIGDIERFKQYFDKPVDYTIELTVNITGLKKVIDDAGEDEKIEWEDDMKQMNARYDSSDVKWQLHNNDTEKNNMEFMMAAKVGDKVKIRLVNNPKSLHPMQHPIHLHGQRFLVLSENGKPNDNMVWKDTALVPVGSTIDILVDVSNPGEWMMHCHIAEHLESGMMTTFNVEK